MATPARCLLGERTVRFTCAGDIHRFRLLHAFVPGDNVVLAIWNIVDFVVSTGVGFSKEWCRTDDDVARHFRVNITQQGHYTGVIECERTLIALGPGAEVMAKLLVAADRWPKHIVL